MNLKLIGQMVHDGVINGEMITVDSPEGRKSNEIISSITKKAIYIPVSNGAQIYYPCGTKRFIANTWYDDINTDEL